MIYKDSAPVDTVGSTNWFYTESGEANPHTSTTYFSVKRD